MPSYTKFAAAALTAMLPFASAQTFSECNPMKKTCPPNDGLTSSSFSTDFTKGDAGLDKWKVTAGDMTTGPDGAEFTVAKKGDAPTIKTPFYFFFGKTEVEMKVAPGTGIVSSIVMQSDDLDEIDWEGLGSYNNKIQTNYFGKGDTSSYDRETWPAVETPIDTFHTYTIDWQKDYITWLVDGKEVRTVKYEEAKGGSRFPQTPMNLRIGVWAGGDPGNPQGTIEWAGGETDYSQAPFTMYVKRVHIENENPAESYTWTDQSGSWQSIEFEETDGGDSDSSSSSSTTKDSTSSSTSSSSDSESTDTTTGSSSEATTTGSKSGFTTSTSTPSSGSGSGSSGGASSSSGAGSGSGSGSGSSTGAGGSSSSSGPSSSSSASTPQYTGAASTLTGLPLTFVGLITAMLQL